MITAKEQQVLMFIRSENETAKKAPTVREIAAHFEIDKLEVNSHLAALIMKGYIRKGYVAVDRRLPRRGPDAR